MIAKNINFIAHLRSLSGSCKPQTIGSITSPYSGHRTITILVDILRPTTLNFYHSKPASILEDSFKASSMFARHIIQFQQFPFSEE